MILLDVLVLALYTKKNTNVEKVQNFLSFFLWGGGGGGAKRKEYYAVCQHFFQNKPQTAKPVLWFSLAKDGLGCENIKLLYILYCSKSAKLFFLSKSIHISIPRMLNKVPNAPPENFTPSSRSFRVFSHPIRRCSLSTGENFAL